jgi:CBS domain containing-hemolysin-like protein
MDIFTTLLIIAFCLLLEGFFSGSEIGVISADQIKLRHQAAKGSKGAKLALKMLEKPEWLLSVTLVGTNISVVTNTTMATALMIHLFGDNGSWLAIAVAAPLIWIFGEIVPKSVFQQRADAYTPYVIFVLRFFSYLFYPMLIIFSFLTRLLAKLAGGNANNPFTLREEIVTMLQMPAATKGDIHPVEKSMIRRMFRFTETSAHDVMRPLIEVTAIEKEATCQEARTLSAEKSHIRLPVYDERIDKIVGMLHTLDLLNVDSDKPILDYIRPAVYVPGNKSIQTLMSQLQREGTVVAIVVDEFGGAEGIVTIEDIIEEVVENLEDEYDNRDEPNPLIRKIDENEYVVSARIEINELCEALKIEIPQGRYATLSGYILTRLHSIPAEGTTIREGDLTLTMQACSEQTVLEVNIRW